MYISMSLTSRGNEASLRLIDESLAGLTLLHALLRQGGDLLHQETTRDLYHRP